MKITEKEVARIQAKIKVTVKTGCWLWTASKDSRGYAQMGIWRDGKNKNCRVHRLNYEHHRGPIPEGMELHHLCEVKHCINPAHLMVCTHKENMTTGKWGQIQRARCAQYQLDKTHCPAGHPLSGENLYVYPDGRRQCRECRRVHRLNWQRAQLERSRSPGVE